MSVSEQEFLPIFENSFPPAKTSAGSGVAREGDQHQREKRRNCNCMNSVRGF
jgi:hypothetical protein